MVNIGFCQVWFWGLFRVYLVLVLGLFRLGLGLFRFGLGLLRFGLR